MDESTNQILDAHEAASWRLRVLNIGSAILALVVSGILVLVTWSFLFTGTRFMPPIAFPIGALFLVAALWRSAAYRTRSLIFLLALFSVQAIMMANIGYVANTSLVAIVAVVTSGLLLGVRWAVGGWIVSTFILLVGVVGMATGLISADPNAVDPRKFAVGFRFLLTYAGLSGVLAIGVTVVVERLSTSLRETHLVAEALRASEAQWRSLVDHAPEVILIVNRERQVEFINRAVPDPIFEQILGEPTDRFVVVDHRKMLAETIESIFQTGKQASFEAWVLAPDGKRTWFNYRLGPVFSNEEVDRVMLIAVDVTEQRDIEEQLKQSQKLEAVGLLTGGVAHNFNNLLTVILGNLELVDIQLKPNDPAREMTGNAVEAANHAASLIQRLLAFSRKQVLRSEAVDLRQLVNGMNDLLQRLLGETIAIETVSDGAQWGCIADRAQLESVILNLAINARDAMPRGGKLTIETANVRLDDEYANRYSEVESGQYAVIAVTDTGTGMSTDVTECAFDPFFTTKETGQGPGLGLSMVHGFVLQSRGHVKIYSELGKGTTVKVYLPRAPALDSEARASDLSEPAPVGNGPERELVSL